MPKREEAGRGAGDDEGVAVVEACRRPTERAAEEPVPLELAEVVARSRPAVVGQLLDG